MSELIKITEHNGKQAVSAHELYNFLCETQNESFGRWWTRQSSYGFVENVDYQRVTFFTAHNNQEVTDYALTINCAKEISMIQKNERGKQARQYFIACEEKLNQKPVSTLEALKYTVQVLEEHEKRLNVIEMKVDRIIENQIEATNELKALSLSTEEVPEITLRDKCRLLLNKYCAATGAPQKAIWDKVHEMLYYQYHIFLKGYTKLNKSETWLGVAERKGLLDKIYNVISQMLREKGIAA